MGFRVAVTDAVSSGLACFDRASASVDPTCLDWKSSAAFEDLSETLGSVLGVFTPPIPMLQSAATEDPQDHLFSVETIVPRSCRW